MININLERIQKMFAALPKERPQEINVNTTFKKKRRKCCQLKVTVDLEKSCHYRKIILASS